MAKESTPGPPTPLYSRNLFTTNWQIGTPTPTPTPAKMAKESTPGTQTPDSFTALKEPIFEVKRVARWAVGNVLILSALDSFPLGLVRSAGLGLPGGPHHGK